MSPVMRSSTVTSLTPSGVTCSTSVALPETLGSVQPFISAEARNPSAEATAGTSTTAASATIVLRMSVSSW